ncbi:hypothetical protein MO867_20530 [Microbulbifer sp. OS29]|uniref:Uncharacterized protein n=1 Tax=Microbulbifer okhotskensis TaxID=2926617 RepID=A0A9X2J6J8_9GAMM|nr:hypothetical protein [Microbulbifer okhotskensis]MCO1336717.1 hypothetical protein [Microbulbifer okhotskensis]
MPAANAAGLVFNQAAEVLLAVVFVGNKCGAYIGKVPGPLVAFAAQGGIVVEH